MVRRPPSVEPSVRTQVVLVFVLLAAGCSPKRVVIRQAADALSSTGDSVVWSGDDDPELVRDALPFALKTMESLLDSQPDHVGLHRALCSGFTQYGYGFVHQDADMAEEKSFAAAQRGWNRARKMYRRARAYCMGGMELLHPGFAAALKESPDKAAAMASVEDVPFLYWLGASLGAEISLSKDRPDVISELPAVAAFMNRALALDEDFDGGAVHEFMITFDAARSEGAGGGVKSAKVHFDRALELNGGTKAGPYVSWAEGVCVAQQDRACFDAMIGKALAVDPDKVKAFRLSNTISQRRAEWLRGRASDLIDTGDSTEETP